MTPRPKVVLQAYAEDYPILRRRGMNHTELATHFGVSVAAIRQRGCRARRAGLLAPDAQILRGA